MFLQLSQGSEALQVDESSNDATQLIVDDIFPVTPTGKPLGNTRSCLYNQTL